MIKLNLNSTYLQKALERTVLLEEVNHAEKRKQRVMLDQQTERGEIKNHTTRTNYQKATNIAH